MENLCRICLAKDANIPIFESNDNEENVHNKLALCVREKVEDIDGYPRNICKPCDKILDSISLFIKRYKESFKILESGLVPNEDIDQSCEPVKIDVVALKTETDVDGFGDESKIDPTLFQFEQLMNEGPATGSLSENANNQNGQRTIVNMKCSTIVTRKQLNIKLKQKVVPKQNVKKKETTNKSDKVQTGKVQCTICSRYSASQYYLNKHIKRMHSNEKSYACNYCVKFFAFKGELGAHIKAAHTKTEGPPEIGKKNIPKPKKNSTDNISPKLCDICGAVFTTSDKLLTHKRKKHIDKPAQCSTCGRVCASVYYLNRHIKRRHNDEKNFVCSICSRAFAFKGELRSHIKSVHVEKTGPPKTYSCKICGKTYKCTKSVVVHERAVHTGERPAVCKVCNASFTHDEYLRHHMRLHTGETPFKCPICGRGYSQSCNMKSHLRIHKISEVDEETLRSLRPAYLKRLKKC